MAAIQDELMSFQDEFSGVKQYLSNFKVKVSYTFPEITSFISLILNIFLVYLIVFILM